MLPTCRHVLAASIGSNTTRQAPAAMLPAAVLMKIGIVFVGSRESRMLSSSAFAAVSPKRESGPCSMAN
jgi:hypothetical protein